MKAAAGILAGLLLVTGCNNSTDHSSLYDSQTGFEQYASTLQFANPIVQNNLTQTFEEQIETLKNTLEHPSVKPRLEKLRQDLLAAQSSLMITDFGFSKKTSASQATVVRFGVLKIGQPIKPVMQLYIRDYTNPSKTDYIRFYNPKADGSLPNTSVGLNSFDSPVSYNVAIFSLTDQLNGLKNAMQSPEVIGEFARINQTIPGATLMVNAYGASGPNTLYREMQWNLSTIQVNAVSAPLATLIVRDYKDPAAADLINYVPYGQN